MTCIQPNRGRQSRRRTHCTSELTPPPSSAAALCSVFRRDYNVNGNEVKAGSTIKWEGQTHKATAWLWLQ